jgi:hypothetical protein
VRVQPSQRRIVHDARQALPNAPVANQSRCSPRHHLKKVRQEFPNAPAEH